MIFYVFHKGKLNDTCAQNLELLPLNSIIIFHKHSIKTFDSRPEQHFLIYCYQNLTFENIYTNWKEGNQLFTLKQQHENKLSPTLGI